MTCKILELVPKVDHLHGATLGQNHLSPLLPEFIHSGEEPTIFLLNLSNAVSVTASYLRSTLHWAFVCGQADVQGKHATGGIEPWAIRPMPLFPVVEGCSADVTIDVDDFFHSRGLPLLLITKRTRSHLKTARMLGSLDGFLQATLQKLITLREATAMQLAEQSSESITVNGWSNRLADLYLLRLVTRKRSGKFWLYSPVAESITLWA